MQATCENCGKTITQEDFSAGRYYLFWLTPTVPSEGLYLCEACKGISWEAREALFHAWMARREARSVRSVRKRRAPSPAPTPRRKKHGTPAEPKPSRTKRAKAQAAPVWPEAATDAPPWWDDPQEKHRQFTELAQMALDLSQ